MSSWSTIARSQRHLWRSLSGLSLSSHLWRLSRCMCSLSLARSRLKSCSRMALVRLSLTLSRLRFQASMSNRLHAPHLWSRSYLSARSDSREARLPRSSSISLTSPIRSSQRHSRRRWLKPRRKKRRKRSLLKTRTLRVRSSSRLSGMEVVLRCHRSDQRIFSRSLLCTRIGGSTRRKRNWRCSCNSSTSMSMTQETRLLSRSWERPRTSSLSTCSEPIQRICWAISSLSDTSSWTPEPRMPPNLAKSSFQCLSLSW